MDVVVTGIGLICSLGSLAKSWQSLLAGNSGIGVHQPFRELLPRPLGLIEETPVQLGYLNQFAVAAALEDAGLTTPLPDCGVAIGSSRGCQALWEQLAGQMNVSSLNPKPYTSHPNVKIEDWLETLPHQGAIAAAGQVGATGPVLSPMAACATGIWAIAQGCELIQMGQCQRVIAGATEAPVTPLTLAGFDKMGVLAKTGCYPFDKDREGLVLGEGAAMLVLESAELALSRGASIYGQVLGFGLTCDAYHVSTPSSNNRSAILAIKQCLDRSNLRAVDIDYIHAHGTSTKLNDQREAGLIEELFPQGVSVSSTKGATGHTLGASGAMGAAFCLMALRDQQLPPCVGLKEPEFDLDLVTVPRRSEIRRVLCFSFGFGGQNGIIGLGKF